MKLKTQLVIIGAVLLVIGLVLDFMLNLFSADPQVVKWYEANKIWILIAGGALILVGIILTILNLRKEGETIIETKSSDSLPIPITLANEDEQFLHEQLARHQENRRQLLKQKSICAAGEEPLHLLNQIAAEEKAIKEIEQQLRK